MFSRKIYDSCGRKCIRCEAGQNLAALIEPKSVHNCSLHDLIRVSARLRLSHFDVVLRKLISE